MTLHADTFAIESPKIVPIVSQPFAGRILVRDGIIAALGEHVDVPTGVPIIVRDTSWVLPGLVDAHTHLGQAMEGYGRGDSDLNEPSLANASVMRALDSINPADPGFADAVAAGVTTVGVMPGSLSPISGQVAVIRTWGRSVDEMVRTASPALKMSAGENPKREYARLNRVPATRMGVAAVIRTSLLAARDYAERRRSLLEQGAPAAPVDPALEPLVEVLEGTRSVRHHGHRADDILTAIRIAQEFGYQLTIEHGTEAHLIADLVAAAGVRVVTGSFMDARPKVELAGKTTRGPGILSRAGVEIAISTDHPVLPIQHLIIETIVAVRDGLDPETALKAITLVPARILGVDDRVGSLEVGKDADLCLWSGDPLDAYSSTEAVWIGGRLVWDTEKLHGTKEDGR